MGASRPDGPAQPARPLARLRATQLGARHHPAAVAAHRRALAATDSGGIYVANLARTLAVAGARGVAAALLRRLEARGDSGRYVPAYEIAKARLALGDRPGALAWLDRARRERSHSLVFLRVDPHLAPLRADARFERLVQQVLRPAAPAGDAVRAALP